MASDSALRVFQISAELNKALLMDSEMPHSLYEHELEEHIDYWYASLQEDNNDFLFVVTENAGYVAMVLIMPDKTLYINDAGREKLTELWPETYETNMKQMIPSMAEQLADDTFPVYGVNIEPST